MPALPLRVLQLLAVWLLTAVIGLSLIALIVVSFGILGEVVGRSFLRAWGRACLWVCRVELVVEGAEHLAGRRPRIITFNHGSTLDSYVVNALLPDRGTPVTRRSLIWVPVMGQVMALGPILMVDRGNGARARKVLARAAERVRREGLSVVIAPEGTRKGEDKPSRFKLGAFELARATGAPIVPMVILGADRLMPYGRYWSAPGRVVVRVLPPRDTSRFTEADLRAEAEALREVYRAEMRAFAG